MDIQELRIFARVAILQNLTAVGQEMGLTAGTISKRLQSLEDELSVRLFDRTTRSIRITDEGATFFEHVVRILSELDIARASVGDKVSQPKGRIRIASPTGLGRLVIAPAICDFLRQYQEIDVHVTITDSNVNLLDDGCDLVIRCGVLPDSSLVARRLADDQQVIVASPAYLAARGTPKQPSDLAGHECIQLGEAQAWPFERDGESGTVRVAGRLRSTNSDFVQQACILGEGLARLPLLEARSALASGKLKQVLVGYDVSASSAIWAVFPRSRHVLPKLRVLVDFLAEWCRSLDSGLRGTELSGRHGVEVNGTR